jgi:sugar (pentulose or hexulose) kinase
VRVSGRAIIVVDIGKTRAKASLWSRDGACLERRSRANAAEGGSLDAAGIETWLLAIVREFAKVASVGNIIPVAHGATAVLIEGGMLVRPPRDYEAPISSDIRARYDRLRGPFAETGSPALPDGLNLGVQLHLEALSQECKILLWPQYWSWRLSGVASSEVTSLGCHSDLWNPGARDFSNLAKSRDWARRFAPFFKAGDVLGPILPDWAVRTGLPVDCQVRCGVHDSNAALFAARGFPEIAGREATLLSTGTWFIAMRSPTVAVALDALPEARDCLVNVDVEGRPVASARFMGGREIEILSDGGIDDADHQVAILATLASVVADGAMILPNFAPGCGPFPEANGKWINRPAEPYARKAATALYAALVVDQMLDLIGSRDAVLIEGRFARASVFVAALAALRPDMAVFISIAEVDVSFGALRLVDPSIKPSTSLQRVAPLAVDLATYKIEWHQNIEGNAA